MKSFFTRIFYLFGLLLIIFIRSDFAQCSLTDSSREALFITYERTAQVKMDGQDKLQSGVILRLHNNSTCTVIITTGSIEKFYKPLSANATVLQRIKREIDYDLPDEELVPEVQYRYQTSEGFGLNVGGDNFYNFNVLGNRSILFEVPLKHFDLKLGGKIDLPFQYAWEQANRAKNRYPSVENFVSYWNGELPDEVKQKIRKR